MTFRTRNVSDGFHGSALNASSCGRSSHNLNSPLESSFCSLNLTFEQIQDFEQASWTIGLDISLIPDVHMVWEPHQFRMVGCAIPSSMQLGLVSAHPLMSVIDGCDAIAQHREVLRCLDEVAIDEHATYAEVAILSMRP